MSVSSTTSSLFLDPTSTDYPSQRQRQLLKSIDTLKQQVEQLKKEGKDNYRVKLIKSLRQQVREQTTVIEALSDVATNRAGLSSSELDDVLDQCLNKPKLARPAHPIKLRKELAEKSREAKKLAEQVNALKRQSNSADETTVEEEPIDAPTLPQLQHELDTTRTSLEAARQQLATQQNMLEKMSAELRSYKTKMLKYDEMEQEHKESQQTIVKLKEQLIKAVADDEQFYQEIRTLQQTIAGLTTTNQKLIQERDIACTQLEQYQQQQSQQQQEESEQPDEYELQQQREHERQQREQEREMELKREQERRIAELRNKITSETQPTQPTTTTTSSASTSTSTSTSKAIEIPFDPDEDTASPPSPQPVVTKPAPTPAPAPVDDVGDDFEI